MKNSYYDLFEQYCRLERIAKEELKRAVMAHGGDFRFMTEDGEEIEGVDPVIVCACESDSETPEDYYISRVTITPNGRLVIYGFPKMYCRYDFCDCLIDSVEFGHTMYITDAIPVTDKIQDVTLTEEEKMNI